MDVLAAGDLALGEGPERVLHRVQVGVEVTGSGHRRQPPGTPGAVGGQEGHGLGQAVGGHVPQRLPAQHPAGQVVHRVGHEGAGQAGFVVAQGAVAEHRARRLDGRGGVGQVVGQHLVRVGPAAGAEVADALAHHLLGQGRRRWRRPGGPGRSWRPTLPSGRPRRPIRARERLARRGARPVRSGRGPDSRPMSRLCVFCGSNAGAAPAFAEAAARLGSALASREIGLVYGGGNVGLMGILADSVIEHGGEVIGVIPSSSSGPRSPTRGSPSCTSWVPCTSARR